MSRFVQILIGLLGAGVVGGSIVAFVLVRQNSTSQGSDSFSQTTSNTTSDSATKTNSSSNTSTGAQKDSSTGNSALDTPGAANESCDTFSIEGRWSLTADVQGATFTPPYANEPALFEFGSGGKVDFVEEYHADGIDASAKHIGTWSKDGCSFQYTGTADGGGTSTEFGTFTLHFDISAPGTLNVGMETLSGNWTSKETYKSSSGVTNQVITGLWTAKKVH